MYNNNPRVYPMDSDMNNGYPSNPTKYVMLSENGGSLRPPPYRRNIPRYHSSPKRKGCSCGKCLCFCCCFLLIFLLLLLSVSFLLYNYFKPKVPNYKVQGLQVGSFNVQQDFSLYTEFIVNVKAENINENIGIIYGKDSSVVVVYSGTQLCSGKLPAFHQEPKNTTMIKVVLKGKSEFGSGLQAALMENRNTGRIPLLIMVKVPVSVVLGQFPMRQVLVMVNCSLVVDNLSPNKKIGILSSKYHVSASL